MTTITKDDKNTAVNIQSFVGVIIICWQHFSLHENEYSM